MAYGISINPYNNSFPEKPYNTRSKNIEILSEKVSCVSQQSGFPSNPKSQSKGTDCSSLLSSKRVHSIKSPLDPDSQQSPPTDSFDSTAVHLETDKSNQLSPSSNSTDLIPSAHEPHGDHVVSEVEKFHRRFTEVVNDMKERVRRIGKITQDEDSKTKHALAERETICKNFDELCSTILETINNQQTLDLLRSFVSYFDKISELVSNGKNQPTKKFTQQYDQFVGSITSKISPELRTQLPDFKQPLQVVLTRKRQSPLPAPSNPSTKKEMAALENLKRKLVNIVNRINGYLEKCKNPEEEKFFLKSASNKRTKAIKSFNLLGNITKYIQNREVFDLVKQFILSYNAISDWQKNNKPDAKVCYFHHVCIFFNKMKQACTDLQKEELDRCSKQPSPLAESKQSELLRIHKNLVQLLNRMRKVVNILQKEKSTTVSQKKHHVFSVFKKKLNEISEHLNDPQVFHLVKEFAIAFNEITRWQNKQQMHLNFTKRSPFFFKSCPVLHKQMLSLKSDMSEDEKQQISGASPTSEERVLETSPEGSDVDYPKLVENIKLIVENAQTLHQETLDNKINRDRITTRKRSLRKRFNQIQKICSLYIKDPEIFKFTVEFATIFDKIGNLQRSPNAKKLGFFCVVFKEFLDEIKPRLTPQEIKQFPENQVKKIDACSKSVVKAQNQRGLKRRSSAISSIELDPAAKEPDRKRRRSIKVSQSSSLNRSEEELSNTEMGILSEDSDSSSSSTSLARESSPAPVKKRVARSLRSGRLQSISIHEAAQRTLPDSECTPDTLHKPLEASSCAAPPDQASYTPICDKELAAPSTDAPNAAPPFHNIEFASLIPTGPTISDEAFDTNMFFSEDFFLTPNDQSSN